MEQFLYYYLVAGVVEESNSYHPQEVQISSTSTLRASLSNPSTSISPWRTLSSSLRKGTLHISFSVGILYLSFLTVLYVTEALGMLQSDAILERVRPTSVLLSSFTRLLRYRMLNLLQLETPSINLTKREHSMVLGWTHAEISSMKYLCVVLGREKIFLIETFHVEKILVTSGE